MATQENVIEIDGLRKQYGHIEALKGLSLHVAEGEIFGLLGANGAGKSTLIKALVGVTRSSGGTLRVLGRNPATESRKLRHEVGYMPQAPALYEDLSPRDNIRFFARAHRIPNLSERIDEVLNFTDLHDRQHDPVHGFSGGMKQRVSLACALVHEPRLLLLDEPSAGVDPKLREAFWQHFHKLTARGVTILISTHQLDEVTHCDRAAIMRAGEVLACDTPHGLLDRGRTHVTLSQNGTSHTETIDHAAESLPHLLGVADRWDRIEVRADTLEDVVLRLIDDRVMA